jgi:hypothetical protein
MGLSTDPDGNPKCPHCGETENISGPKKDENLGMYVWTCHNCPGPGHDFH